MSCAALDPTLPKPCTITRALERLIPSLLQASSHTTITPRPVASRRPRDPPMLIGFPVTAVVTGKPINIGGSRGRREATGRGVMVVCDEACNKLGISRSSARVVVQGFGNVGSNAAQLMHEAGYKVIGIAEVGGGLHNKNGIDLKKLVEYRQKNGTVHGFPEAEKAETADLLTTEC